MDERPRALIGETVTDTRGGKWVITHVNSVSKLQGFNAGSLSTTGGSTSAVSLTKGLDTKVVHVGKDLKVIRLEHVQAVLSKNVARM